MIVRALWTVKHDGVRYAPGSEFEMEAPVPGVSPVNKAKPEPKPAPAEDPPLDLSELEGMTKRELLEFAEDLGVDVSRDDLKAEIFSTLKLELGL